jgi:hypothetical protein
VARGGVAGGGTAAAAERASLDEYLRQRRTGER